MQCPKCNSTKVVKNGFTNQNQLYLCSDCMAKFTFNKKGRPKTQKPCVICGKPSLAKSLCSKHYTEQYRKNKS